MVSERVWKSYLYDGLGDEGVEVRHQFAVDVCYVEMLGHHGDEAHRPVADPQVGVAQEWGFQNKGKSSLQKVPFIHNIVTTLSFSCHL